MPYSPTVWQNGTTPALNATNLNKLKNELASQALAQGISHTLPTWANGVSPALSDAAPLNEMERVADAVASDLNLSYSPTAWQSGWVPARNAANLNKLEAQAQANRVVLDGTPVSGTLPWTPPGYPTYAGYTTVHASNAAHNFSTTPRQGLNLRVIIDSPITDTGNVDRRLTVSGWRNVVIIGGEMNRNASAQIGGSNNVGIQIDRCDGIVHLEGLKIWGPGVIDCCVTTSGPESGGAAGADVRIQNCYFENNALADIHADGFQLWSDPGGGFNGGVKSLNSYNWTIHANWQGIFLGTHDGVIQSFDIRNTNIVGIPPRAGATHQGVGWIFFKGCYPDTGGFFGTGGFTNTWVDNEIGKWGSYPHMVTPNENGDDGSGGQPCHKANNPLRACVQNSDATGSYINWPSSPDIAGKMYIGRPPVALGGVAGNVSTAFGNRDFVPINGNVGMSYVSPGYV